MTDSLLPPEGALVRNKYWKETIAGNSHSALFNAASYNIREATMQTVTGNSYISTGDT